MNILRERCSCLKTGIKQLKHLMFGNKVTHLPRVLEALHTTEDFSVLKPFHVKEKSPDMQSSKLKNNPFHLLF